MTHAQQTVLSALTHEPQLIGKLSCQGPAVASVLLYLARQGLVVLFQHDIPRLAPAGSVVTTDGVYHAACLSARGVSYVSQL